VDAGSIPAASILYTSEAMLLNKNSLFRLSPLLLLIFIDSFSFFVVIPVLLKIFYHNHYALLPSTTPISERNTLTGIVISLSMFSALFSAPIVGKASDQYGRKKTLLFCIGCISLGFLFPIIGIMQKNIYLIFIGRIISGIGSASQPIAQAAVADVCQREDKAVFLGSIALMMTLALILGPLAGGVLSNTQLFHWLNSKTPFEFALMLSMINLLLILFFFTETAKINQQSKLVSLCEVIIGLPRLIRSYQLGGLMLLFFCLELGWSQYYQSISLFLHLKSHFSVEKISLFGANMGIVMVIGLLILYPLLLRIFSVKNIMRYNVMLVFFGLSACALFPLSTIQWIFSALVALSTGMAYVSLVTLISNQVAVNEQGLAMGYLSAILYFAWMATAFCSGFLISLYIVLPLYVAALFLLVPGCLVFFNFRANQQRY